MNIPKPSPYAMAIAGPLRNWAAKLLDAINGPRPAIVVMDVKIIGLNLDLAVSESASLNDLPSFNKSLKVEMKTSALFTNTPINAIVPITEKILMAVPCTQWPKITPIKANGNKANTRIP